MIGRFHHPYQMEKRFLATLVSEGDHPVEFAEALKAYWDLLAPQPLRAARNAVICLVTVTCRAVIEEGVDAEQSYSLSDHYINEVERQPDEKHLRKLMEDILHHYAALVREARVHSYPLPVTRAVRHIDHHLYGSLHVREVAEAVRLHPNYLSSLFRESVGINLTTYIRHRKMKEAKELLRNTDRTVTEIAGMLGYSDIAAFSNAFRKHFGFSPKMERKGLKTG